MKNNKIIKSILAILMIAIAMSSCKKCEYIECTESCDMIETFNDTVINWQGQIHLKEIVDTVNRVLHVGYGFPGEAIANEKDFPNNLITAGCKMKYDVAYKDLFDITGTNPTNGLIIYAGSFPGPFTNSAEFVLNTSSSLVSGNALTTIEVPLVQASGTTLPSNAFGQWIINGIASPTATDIADFNTLIQNIDGVSFNLDWSDGEEEWWFDNFCISNCCSKRVEIEDK